jgi:hypothetical protein
MQTDEQRRAKAAERQRRHRARRAEHSRAGHQRPEGHAVTEPPAPSFERCRTCGARYRLGATGQADHVLGMCLDFD